MAPNSDGTKGFFLTGASREFWEWVEFFEKAGMPFRASHYRANADKGGYFPAFSPCDMDASFLPSGRRTERKADLLPGEREAVVARVMAKWTAKPRSHRYTADDMREAKPAMPEPRPMTEAEIASMRRLIGEPA